MLQGIERVEQDLEQLESENKLLRHTTEKGLDGTVQEGSCSTKVVDQVVL